MKPQIAFHGCDSPQQDALYGDHMRVFNFAPGNKGAEKSRYHYTVCGSVKDISTKEGK